MAEIVGTPPDPNQPTRRRRRATPRPFARWAPAAQYDPEAESAARFATPTDEYLKRFALPAHDGVITERIRKESKAAISPTWSPVVDATLQVPSIFRESGRTRWRLKPTRVVGGLHDYAQFAESDWAKLKFNLEANGNPFDTGGYVAGGQSPTALIDQNEFVPTLMGPFYKQLYWYDYLSMHARAFELVNHHALAASVVRLMYRFTVGRGLSFTIKNTACKQVWDEYWERNNMRVQARQAARDVTWQGELFTTWSEPHDGYLASRLRDPSIVWEFVTDPEDYAKVYYAHVQFPTPYQVWVQGNIPVSKYIIKQIPPTQFTHSKLNTSAEEKRGRSDLIAAMPYIKRFDDFYTAAVVRAMVETGMVFKLKVHGDDADLQRFAADPQVTQLPPPGSTWLENDAVDLSALAPQLSAGSRGSQGIGQQLAAIVFMSMNLPSEYANVEGSSAARATALVRTDPAVKAVEDRQQLLKEMYEDQYDRVMESALRAGRISRDAAKYEPETKAEPGELSPPEDEEDDGLPKPVSAHWSEPQHEPVRARLDGGPVPSQFAGPVRSRLVPGGGPQRARLVRG